MPTADTRINNNGLPAPPGTLRFQCLPAYAQFLLDHKLEEFSASLLQNSRQLNVPLLRFFDAMPEAQLLALAIEGNRKLLTAFAQDTVDSYLAENLRSWRENQLPLIQGDDIVIEDISKVNFIRRKAFRDFMPQYSSDPAMFIKVMEEVDFFTLAQEEASYKTLFELKEKKIREHHHFIEKINNTSPGNIYVFDLATQKQVYTNHKPEDLLGYTEQEIAALPGGSIADLLHPDDLPHFRQHYQDLINVPDGDIRTIEYRILHKNGRYSWRRGYETVFKRTDQGRPAEIIGIALDVTLEKEASIQLQHQEAQLREAQELAGMGSFDWDLNGAHSIYSPQLFKIFEMNGASNLMDFLRYVHPADQPLVKEAIARALSGTELYECEYRYRRNGPEKYIWSRGKVSFKDGKPSRMQGTVMDITQRHEMVKRLERSEKLHKQAQALTHIGNWSWSLPDDLVEWSDEMYRIFGLEPQSETMTLGRALNLIHPEDRPGRYEALHHAIATTHTDDYRMRVLRPNGGVRYVEGKTEVLADDNGKPYKIVGTCQDITRQHLLNEQLRENEEASSQLINNAPEGIVVIDEESHILLWNPKAEVIFGWNEEEIRGMTLMDTIIPSDFRQAHAQGIDRLQSTGIGPLLNQTIEVTALKKDGSSFYISLTISRSVRAGKPIYIAFIRDITHEKATELKLVEQQIQLAQKNRELEHNNQELMAFNYIASHDLQEPVRKIQIFSNLILENGGVQLPVAVKDYLGRISSAAAHMHGLIDALIAFSRASSLEGTFEQTDLNAILSEVEAQLKDRVAELGAVIIISKVPVLRGIPFQLQQLFENLISNSLKYRHQGVIPHIQISSELVPGSQLEGKEVDIELDYYRISVTDNGIGFEQRYAEKVFELFQRLHNRKEYTGTGIGLAICKKIVQNHGGFISARSRVGEGTTFDIFLPVTRVGRDLPLPHLA